MVDLRPIVDLIDVEPEPLVTDEDDEEVEETHTLELELLDPDGAPVPNAAYSVELPGGEVVTGQLNALGKAMLTGIHGSGSCKITCGRRASSSAIFSRCARSRLNAA